MGKSPLPLIAHRLNRVIRVPNTGRSEGPTDLLMQLREVHHERIRDVDFFIPKMLGKRTTIDEDDVTPPCPCFSVSPSHFNS